MARQQTFEGNEDPISEGLARALAEQVAALGSRGLLTVVELASGGIVVWNVQRDNSGTPRVRQTPKAGWTRLSGEDGMPARDLVRDLVLAASPSAAMVVRTAPGGLDVSWAMTQLKQILPAADVFDWFGELGELILDTAAGSPLAQMYELVVACRSGSGELSLGGRRLFSIGAQRGETSLLTVTCEPGNGGKVVFAVVASELVRDFRLVAVSSARLAPGLYHLTAELVRPGLVRFAGLPVPLRPESRSWAELVASVPQWLPAPQPTHLICAVELSGPRDLVQERLDRISWLIRNATMSGGDLLKASIVAYGPHGFGPGETDPRPEIPVWAGSREAALTAVRRLSDRDGRAPGYPSAAQLECALADIGRLLDPADGRPVLVTAGSRPPFPDRVDARSGILPCPRRRSWRDAVQRLQVAEGIVFGAIRDEDPPVPGGEPDDIWTALGQTAVATIRYPPDEYDFPERLGLLSAAAQHVPFPIVNGGQG
jgi:hypothetical protein